MTLHSELYTKDIKNLLDDGSGEITFGDFCTVMDGRTLEVDEETFYKETFRTFGKDQDGCIPADEMIFVFQHLGVSYFSYHCSYSTVLFLRFSFKV